MLNSGPYSQTRVASYIVSYPIANDSIIFVNNYNIAIRILIASYH